MNRNIERRQRILRAVENLAIQKQTQMIQFESNLRKKVTENKLSKLIAQGEFNDKIKSIIEKLSNIDQNNLNKILSNSSDNQSTQTDIRNTTFENLEREHYIFQEQIFKLTREKELLKYNLKENQKTLEDLKIELENTKLLNEKLQRKNEELTIIMETMNNDINLLSMKNQKFTKEIFEMETFIKQIEFPNKISKQPMQPEYEEDSFTRDSVSSIQNSNQNSPDIFTILDKGKLNYITKYLDPADIFKLRHQSKRLYLYIDTNPTIMKQLFINTVNSKNRLIDEIHHNHEYDSLNGNFQHINKEIEKLVEKYNPKSHYEQKYLKEIQNTIFKSIDFINSEIKYNLGMSKVNKLKNQNKSLLNGLGNMFSGIFNVPHQPQSRPRILSNDNLDNEHKEESINNFATKISQLDFDYKSPQELKGLVHTYFFHSKLYY
jgi:hypothetical protein